MPVDERRRVPRPTVPVARRWRLVRAPKVAVPASVRRFNQRARAHRIRSARPWIITAVTIVVLGSGAWVLYGTSVLGVDRITVTGAGFVGEAAVRDAAGVSVGTPLASIDTSDVAARVEKLPGVRVARVRRDWPGTLIISITRRTAVAAAPVGSTYVLLDASGVAFRTVSVAPDVTLISLATPGRDDPATLSALSVLRSLPPQIRDQLMSMTAASSADITLLLQSHRTVIWGDSSDNVAKGRVATSLLLRPGTVIDVSAPNVVTVR